MSPFLTAFQTNTRFLPGPKGYASTQPVRLEKLSRHQVCPHQNQVTVGALETTDDRP